MGWSRGSGVTRNVCSVLGRCDKCSRVAPPRGVALGDLSFWRTVGMGKWLGLSHSGVVTGT